MGDDDRRGDLPDLPSFRDFDEAARETLKFLQARHDFDLWMVTRTVRDDWIVLQSEDRSYDVRDGDVFRWSDSFCSRMVRGDGPHIASDSSRIAAYRDAPIGQSLPIGSYVGYPLTNADGSLFGTLCAIDPKAKSADIEADAPLFQLLAQYLSLAIANEMRSYELQEQIESLSDQAHRDPLTGLLNRRSWDELLDNQEMKCRVLGEPAAVVMIDLDGLKAVNDTRGHEAGDAYITAAADAVGRAARRNDVVARIGGDEFALMVEAPIALDPEPLLNRIRDNLETGGVSASIGWAGRDSGGTLNDAVKRADRLMYADKARRKAARKA